MRLRKAVSVLMWICMYNEKLNIVHFKTVIATFALTA